VSVRRLRAEHGIREGEFGIVGEEQRHWPSARSEALLRTGV
jgi:hypothetical protein